MTDYGIDVSTVPDLDATFALISGPRVVAENVARRLEEVLADALNADVTPDDLRAVQAASRTVALEDERVLDAVVSATLVGETLRIDVRLALLEGESFQLVLNASAVSVEVLIGNL